MMSGSRRERREHRYGNYSPNHIRRMTPTNPGVYGPRYEPRGAVGPMGRRPGAGPRAERAGASRDAARIASYASAVNVASGCLGQGAQPQRGNSDEYRLRPTDLPRLH